jgi:hypothetical protein
VEKDCEHEGLRLDMERRALEPGRMAGILDAMLAWWDGSVYVYLSLEQKVAQEYCLVKCEWKNYESGL